MPAPMQMKMSVFKYILAQKLKRRERYPLVMMLEPLFACNLECAGCGKIQYPVETLRKRLTPQECWDSADECGAPIVSIAGGEPLVHAEIDVIVKGLIERGYYIYLCSNAILLEKNLHRFTPDKHLIFSIHLDGREPTHDQAVCRKGVHRSAVSAIREAKRRGFQVMTNTTVFQKEDPEEFRCFFDECMALGVDGMMISPGYAYEKAPKQDVFLKRQETQTWFRKALEGWSRKGWDFNHSPFYLDFLSGLRDYECTPWGNPLRNVFGWQKPCYLLSDGGYAKTFSELLEGTDWSLYGRASGNPKCANCMVHVGYEPSSVTDGFSSLSKFFELAWRTATVAGPRKAEKAYERGGKSYEDLVAEHDARLAGVAAARES